MSCDVNDYTNNHTKQKVTEIADHWINRFRWKTFNSIPYSGLERDLFTAYKLRCLSDSTTITLALSKIEYLIGVNPLKHRAVSPEQFDDYLNDLGYHLYHGVDTLEGFQPRVSSECFEVDLTIPGDIPVIVEDHCYTSHDYPINADKVLTVQVTTTATELLISEYLCPHSITLKSSIMDKIHHIQNIEANRVNVLMKPHIMRLLASSFTPGHLYRMHYVSINYYGDDQIIMHNGFLYHCRSNTTIMDARTSVQARYVMRDCKLSLTSALSLGLSFRVSCGIRKDEPLLSLLYCHVKRIITTILNSMPLDESLIELEAFRDQFCASYVLANG